MNEPAPFNWKLLLGRLQKGKAILLLGPEVVMAAKEGTASLKEALQIHLQTTLDGILEEQDLKRIEYYSEDGFFYLEDSFRLDVVEAIMEFYEALPVTNLHRQIAQLPFSLVLSLSPDKVLCQAFDELNLPYHYHFYDKKNYNETKDDEILPKTLNRDKRLIYNVFGSIENEDSLIVSYDDLFEFLQKVLNNYNLPKTVREAIMDANYFVFVGFNYGKWYLKLLLRIMDMQNKVRKVYGMDEPSNKAVETFFMNEFDMNFSRKNATDFIQELFEKCQKHDLLIHAPTDQDAIFGKLPKAIIATAKKHLIKGDTQRGIDELLEYARGNPVFKEMETDLIMLSQRLSKLERDNLRGIVSDDDYRLNINKISNGLLTSIDQSA